jgi:hypothetical protein
MRAKEFVTEKKKRKKHKMKYNSLGPGPYGWYGFIPGYSGEYDSSSGGGDGGGVAEEWSDKYKRSINCGNPKGFSQRAHCQGRKKHEDVEQNVSKDIQQTDMDEKQGQKWERDEFHRSH